MKNAQQKEFENLKFIETGGVVQFYKMIKSLGDTEIHDQKGKTMKITRTINGQEITIELTKQELLEAYYEAEQNYFREGILQWAEDNEKEIDDDLIEKILGELDKNYKSGYSLWDNISFNYNWFVWLRKNK